MTPLMTLAVQHQLLILWFALYTLTVVGLVTSSFVGNGGYSFCRDRRVLVFRRQRLTRYCCGLMALLIALVPTLGLRSFTLGIWPHFWCYLFGLGISFFAGPMDVTLFVEDATYKSAVGFPLLPAVKTGRFQDFAGIGLTNTRNAYLVTVKVTVPKERLLILGAFGRRDKAIAFVQQIVEMTGIPIMQNALAGK